MSNSRYPKNPAGIVDNRSTQDIASPKFLDEIKELGSLNNPELELIIQNLLNNVPSTKTLNLNFRSFSAELDNDEKLALYDAISKNKILQHLTLETLRLDDSDASKLVEALKKRKSEKGDQLTLNYLSLRMNEFTLTGTKVLATAPINLLSMKLTKLDDAAALNFVSSEAVIPKVELNDNRLTANGVRSLIENNKKNQILEWDWLSTALANPYVGDQSNELRTEIESAKQNQTNKKTKS